MTLAVLSALCAVVSLLQAIVRRDWSWAPFVPLFALQAVSYYQQRDRRRWH